MERQPPLEITFLWEPSVLEITKEGDFVDVVIDEKPIRYVVMEVLPKENENELILNVKLTRLSD